MRRLILRPICLGLFLALTVSHAWGATITLGSKETVANGLSLKYAPETGRVRVEAPAGTKLTAFEIRSTSQRFTSVCEGLSDPFEVCTSQKVFALDVAGFATAEFGPVLPTGLNPEEVMADLVIDGATLGGGFDLGDGLYLIHPAIGVPEPTALGVSLLAALAFRRRKSAR